MWMRGGGVLVRDDDDDNSLDEESGDDGRAGEGTFLASGGSSSARVEVKTSALRDKISRTPVQVTFWQSYATRRSPVEGLNMEESVMRVREVRVHIMAAASVRTRSEMRVLSISRDARFVQVRRTGSMPASPRVSQ